MNIRSLFSLLAVSGLTVATTLMPQYQARAEQVNFICETKDGKPATIAQHSEHGNVPIIVWETNYFSNSGYTPKQRCEEVSNRFQKYHEQNLNYSLTTGRKNNLPVICVAKDKGGPCSGILFTLRPEDNSNKYLKQLRLNRAGQASGGYVTQDDGSLMDSTYIKLNQLIEEKAKATTPASEQN